MNGRHAPPAGHAPADDDMGGPGRRAHRLLLGIVAAAAACTMIGAAVLWPTGADAGITGLLGPPADLVPARVAAVETEPCAGTGGDTGGDTGGGTGGGGTGGTGGGGTGDLRCTVVTVVPSQGPDRGTAIQLNLAEGSGTPTIAEGDRVVLGFTPDAPAGSQYYLADFERRGPMVLLAGLFVLAVVALGRMRGLRALLALAFTLGVLVWFLIPAVLDGRSPVAVAVVASSAIVLVNLYLSHGNNLHTTTAVVGTLASLALIGVLAVVFVGATHLTGIGSEEASFLQAASGRVNLQGLLLGGIIIGSLGVLDDVTVTQASAVWELHQADPAMGPAQLYKAALRIGRDHVASTVNTLVLAYAGASLPLLILLTQANRRVADVLTGEVVAGEIVRTLVGSVGLVASVPITTALAATVVGNGRWTRGG